MQYHDLFERFDREGKLSLPGGERAFADIPWSRHPAFEGVELKHILTSKETGGAFSFHLVRIAAGKKIGDHVHAAQLETHEVIAGVGVCISDGRELVYAPGVVSILPANVPHEVVAGEDGLFLFAKFIPALN